MVSNPSAPAGIRPPIHLLDSQSDLLGNLALMAEHRIPVVSAMLLTEIERAEIHDRDTLPRDVVTLGSELEYLDEGSGAQRWVRLVLPAEADIEAGRVVPHADVAAWLDTWGTPQDKPIPKSWLK